MAATREIAGRRYATAVLEIARQDGDLDGWLEAMDGLEGLTSRAGYVIVLQGEDLPEERFLAIVREVMPGANEKQVNLLRLLRRKNRLALGPSIAAFFREMVDEERGVLRATVTTAVDLDDERRRALIERLESQTGKQVVVQERVDPSLLGGLVVRIGDRLVDGSARTRLRQLRSRLEQAPLS